MDIVSTPTQLLEIYGFKTFEPTDTSKFWKYLYKIYSVAKTICLNLHLVSYFGRVLKATNFEEFSMYFCFSMGVLELNFKLMYLSFNKSKLGRLSNINIRIINF